MLKLFLIAFFIGLLCLLLLKWVGSKSGSRSIPRRTPHLKSNPVMAKDEPVQDAPPSVPTLSLAEKQVTAEGSFIEAADNNSGQDAKFSAAECGQESQLIEEEVPSLHERRVLPKEIITLYIMAPDNNPYRGYELLQALLACGLRYGKMNIFHRYADNTEESDTIFSLASAQHPGSFDLPNMGSCVCKGLVLFMQLAEGEDNIKSMNLLLKTAGVLTEELTGELRGSDQQPLSEAKMAKLMDKVRRYEALKLRLNPELKTEY